MLNQEKNLLPDLKVWSAKQIANLKFTAVRSLVGDSGEFEVAGDGVVSFLSGTDSVTDEAIQTEMNRIQAEYDDTAWKRTRAANYDGIVEQLDQLWHDIDDDKVSKDGSWYKAVKAVKDATPKT